MRLLMVTPHFPPQLSAEAICNGKLARALAGQGARVTVVAQDHRYSPFKKDESAGWEDPGVETVFLEPPWYDLAPRPIASLSNRLRSLDPVATRFSAMARKPCRQLLRRERFDAIFTPYDGLPTGFDLHRESGLPWVMGINDPFPECLYPEPYGPGGPRSRRERRQVEWMTGAFAAADLAVFPCPRLAAHHERMLGIELGDRAFILNHVGWRRAADPARKKIGGVFEVLHAGTFDSARVTPEFFVWFAEELARFPDLQGRVRLIFMGRKDEAIIEFIRERGLDRLVAFETPVPYEESLTRLASADALLLMEARLREGIFLPSKFCDYVASGKPLLLFCPEPGTVADLVGAGHPGFLGQDERRVRAKLAGFFAALGQGGLDRFRALPADRFDGAALAGAMLERMRGRGK